MVKVFDRNTENPFLHSDEESGNGLLQREDIDPKYTWNLNDIYATEEKWEEDFTWVDKNYSRVKEFSGKLGNSAEVLIELFKLDEEITKKLEHLFLYAMLAKDRDLRVPKYQGLDNRIKSLYTKVSSVSSFIRPELLTLDEKTINTYLENKELAHYRHFFDELLRTKKHTLSIELEEQLAASGEVTGLAYDAFSIFTNADLKFPNVADEKGNDVAMTHGRYQSALYSIDRDYRERAYKTYYTPFKEYVNTLATLFNGNLKAKIFHAKARKYQSAREASLDNNNIPLRVYDNLVLSVSDNLDPMHRWMELKKKILKVDELHPYDVYVTLFGDTEERKYSYDESLDIVKKSLAPLGEGYKEILETAFNNRWIDVYETPGKRSGAYSSGTTFGMHPYVLLNWNSLLNDVFTLTHEMGHNVHSYLTGKHQPFVYADYSIFLAEVASTFNESLLLDYLLKNSQSKQEKMSLMERYLNNVSATFYRQTMFAEFEMKAYERIESGSALTPDDLREMYASTYKKYMGSALTVDTEEEFTWARVPHFYYNFYVFQYATGFAASEALAQQVKTEGQPAVDRYFSFLKAGKSDYPITILKNAGVDMASPEPAIKTARRMTEILNELEKLID